MCYKLPCEQCFVHIIVSRSLFLLPCFREECKRHLLCLSYLRCHFLYTHDSIRWNEACIVIRSRRRRITWNDVLHANQSLIYDTHTYSIAGITTERFESIEAILGDPHHSNIIPSSFLNASIYDAVMRRSTSNNVLLSHNTVWRIKHQNKTKQRYFEIYWHWLASRLYFISSGKFLLAKRIHLILNTGNRFIR